MYGALSATSVSSAKSIFLPTSILLSSGSQMQVYIAENGKAVLRNVTTGGAIGDKIEITSGLNAGDKVITTGINNLNNGVTIVEQ